jgi:hypothetical protein
MTWKSADGGIDGWWTRERVEQLKELWTSQLSAHIIARRLGTSRMAVYCKRHKLGLPPRRKPRGA